MLNIHIRIGFMGKKKSVVCEGSKPIGSPKISSDDQKIYMEVDCIRAIGRNLVLLERWLRADRPEMDKWPPEWYELCDRPEWKENIEDIQECLDHIGTNSKLRDRWKEYGQPPLRFWTSIDDPKPKFRRNA